MPIAMILELIRGVVSAAPSAIAAVESLKAMLAEGKEHVTKEELASLLDEARIAHEGVQDA